MPHKWSQITDLPADVDALASPELKSVAGIWKEQAARLQAINAVQAFNGQLAREWSIETGVIENVYHIDKGVTLLLIEKGIEASLIPHGASDRPAEEVVQIVRDHQAALDGLFAFVKQQRELSGSYICELHAQMLKHQTHTVGQNSLGDLVEIELVRGQYKKLANNPSIPGIGLHEYCPPEHAASEMDNLVAWHRTHVKRGVSTEVEAAWLHHRFTQIHPFQDGNGRIARALASLVFIREGYFPLLITRDTRAEYIDALGKADNGDLQPLIALFARVQKGSLVKALSLSEDVIRRNRDVENVIDAAIERLSQRDEEVQEKQKRVFEFTHALEGDALARCEEMEQLLTTRLREKDRNYNSVADRSEPRNDFWYKGQIAAIARQHNYFADTMKYKAWVRLRIFDARQSSIVLSFHSVGARFVGILGVSAFVEFRETEETQHGTPDGPYAISHVVFEFSYLDDLSSLRDRFSRWLGDALAMGLDQWRRQL